MLADAAARARRSGGSRRLSRQFLAEPAYSVSRRTRPVRSSATSGSSTTAPESRCIRSPEWSRRELPRAIPWKAVFPDVLRRIAAGTTENLASRLAQMGYATRTAGLPPPALSFVLASSKDAEEIDLETVYGPGKAHRIGEVASLTAAEPQASGAATEPPVPQRSRPEWRLSRGGRSAAVRGGDSLRRSSRGRRRRDPGDSADVGGGLAGGR